MTLAHELHLTIGQLRDMMTEQELVLHIAYMQVRAERERAAMEKASRKR